MYSRGRCQHPSHAFLIREDICAMACQVHPIFRAPFYACIIDCFPRLQRKELLQFPDRSNSSSYVGLYRSLSCKKHLIRNSIMSTICGRIPVIFDEVFTGLWRLGRPSAAEFLGVHPDIACYAKLLTGDAPDHNVGSMCNITDGFGEQVQSLVLR